MNELLQSPEFIRWGLVLIRITFILAIAWLLHFMHKNHNSRWQIPLWRMTAIAVLITPFLSPWLAGWGFTFGKPIPLDPVATLATITLPDSSSSTTSADTAASPTAIGSSGTTSEAPQSPATATMPIATATKQPSLGDSVVQILAYGYAIVVACHLLTMVAEMLRLRRILKRSVPANEQLSRLTKRIAARSGLSLVPDVVLSTEIFGPMTTGLSKHSIVIPARLPNQLTEQQMEFVVAHECSHLRNRDLGWSLLVGLVRIVAWPHPLAWGVPAAHRLACDLRCDAAAAGEDSSEYGAMLAQMALSDRAAPQAQMSLAFLTKPDVLHRISRVQSSKDGGRLTRRNRWISALLVLSLCVAGTAGINGCVDGDGFFGAVDLNETDEIQVTVTDADGNPVHGAEVRIDGLRAEKEAASGHGNRLMTKGTTNEQGVAVVKYPRYVYEEMETGQLVVTTTHPDFVMHQGDYSVDSPVEIRVQAGRRVTITAINATNGEAITEGLYGLLPGRYGSRVLTKTEDGILVSNAVAPETRTLLLVAVREDQPPLFSDLIDLSDYEEEHAEVTNVAMSLGERLTGSLSKNVPRPVSEGKVGLGIALTLNAHPSYDTCVFWRDYVLINPDGTFEFSSVPRGAVVQLTAVNEDWVSVSASPEQILERFPYVNTLEHAQNMHDSMVIGQMLAPAAPRPVVVEMEPTATCNLTIVDNQGQPIEGATVYMSPNMALAPGPGGIIGNYYRTADGLGKTAEELRAWFMEKRKTTPANPVDNIGRYMASTDKAGQATIGALPGKQGEHINVDHKKYELPTLENAPFHRGTHVDLSPGETCEVTLTLQGKGIEVLGR